MHVTHHHTSRAQGDVVTKEKENVLYRCPKCGRFVPPVKRPSIAGVWFFAWFYVAYYYLFKKSECVYCGYRFKKSDLKVLESKEMEVTEKAEIV